ncbi:uncharacterized protein LOC131636454 [Vicia villosa]|uniref:uncharacterized protein LOC131636454 n=1 Tax=Vicia villosa TaxID=3911 RepID=UPI00273C0D14|nr:uncharacterized protein LOC131636454 [Vicia villosa]
MDESWRTPMGLTSALPRRRSMEHRSSSRSIFSNTGVSETETLDAEDFADVFGGPPRSLLTHKFSRSGSFYEEIFKQPVFGPPAAAKNGRSLPVFRIPTQDDAFYGDIFGSDDDRRSRERSGSQSNAKSKSNSSSAISSEELSPLRPEIGDDVALSDFASKLRPIKVPYKWNSSTVTHEEQPIKQKRPLFPCQDNGSSRRVTSPETISAESNSYQSIKLSTYDWELSSPFSAVSGVCQEPELKHSVYDHVLPELVIAHDDDDDEDDEVMSSYVIEINSSFREENCGTEAIDDAIAWAKEKFHSRTNEESSLRDDGNKKNTGMEGRPCAGEYHDGVVMVESPEKVPTETEKLDRDIRLWSSDKETDIRQLLSTLHHILWPESGWSATPYMSLIENSQVKKAYQKARLCLHPDKLQQRGATLLQKYVAEKAFSILQDAWTAFLSEEFSF